MRKQISHSQHFSSNECPPTESDPLCEHESFIKQEHQILRHSCAVSNCIFSECTSSDNGGAICFLSSGTFTVSSSSFDKCRTDIGYSGTTGGGAIFTNSSSQLSVTLTVFIDCVSSYSFGGAILGAPGSTSVEISLCSFILCKADHGGGMSTHHGPTCAVCSSRFVLCDCTHCGGGLFHNSLAGKEIAISDSLFKGNTARCSSSFAAGRGGGGFEDYRESIYESKYSFLFFSENNSPYGKGNDITLCQYPIERENVLHCLTTRSSEAFWNTQTYGYVNWLHLVLLMYILNAANDIITTAE